MRVVLTGFMQPVGEAQEFDALAAEPGVVLRWVSEARQLGCPDLVILPPSADPSRDARGPDVPIAGMMLVQQ